MDEAELQGDLAEQVGQFKHDPLGWVLFAFPWGEPGTELEHETGPRQWQRERLEAIGEALRQGELTGDHDVVRSGAASGHGIGKSALVAWLCLWSMSTHPDTRGTVTANTDTQLRSKTWPELSKWHRLCIVREWFKLTATRLHSSIPGRENTWRIDIIPWSEHNHEAFAGLHNQGKRIILIFDEASAIPDKIWEVAEGALTDADTEILWCVFGNPTRNVGRFRECWGRFQHRWDTVEVDSRRVEGTNLKQLEQWVHDYGEDSDFVRVRVRGMFPRASDLQFISTEIVEQAMKRELPEMALDDPLVLGVDIARGGDDRNVLFWRRGRCARKMHNIPDPIVIAGEETRNTMRFVALVTDLIDKTQPDAVFMDGTGVGGPLIDRIRQLRFAVHEVQFGGRAPDRRCKNMRAYMWMRMRDWLGGGGVVLPDWPELERDLCGPEYAHDTQDRLVLEPKERMKERGLASPDLGDALALTFAAPVVGRSLAAKPAQVQTEYDPFANV